MTTSVQDDNCKIYSLYLGDPLVKPEDDGVRDKSQNNGEEPNYFSAKKSCDPKLAHHTWTKTVPEKTLT